MTLHTLGVTDESSTYVSNPGADPEFGQEGPQVLRLKVADIVELSHMSEVSYLWMGFRACSRALEAFGFFSAQIWIIPYSRDSFSVIFDIYFNTKSKDFYFQFALVEKWYAEQREAGQFLNLNYEK